MERDVEYSSRERFGLWALAVFGFVAANGTFLWAWLTDGHARR